ncbi:RDD family protein [Nocardioides sp. zg-DK7169]|uniref:RDD family protein n=1 Tax=Nocardioides sp. zg-DK7169 TaxID=2736600 RepID=UPI00155729C6|nr:RDD family protein [Nocardioides sp. zg-DK7169]NPC96744.1 RDD family protein [Nocardioides sp. zg-DK7169]
MTSVETTSWARRILALIVDWAASTLAVVLIVGPTRYAEDPSSSFWVLLVFVIESAVLTALSGGSFGQIATRLRVVRVNGDPRPIGLIQAFVRQVLVALVIPPLVFRPDGRGLHDLAVGSATVTLQTWRGMTGR